ncbi:hypothetical protein V494_08440 [Pseudogymnoascus sp. VKM F-4513 (FW-928)]|nr:hypothetical protein V494_08440 [Pseudogymnoascus sp. VKM F-4513 (FW-928)]
MAEETFFQISLDRTHRGGAYQNGDSGKGFSKELGQFRDSLLKSCPQWPPAYNSSASPLPLVIPETLANHLDGLGNSLCRAVTDIVGRWWSDSTANFPQRMPLQPHQEEILRWIENEGRKTVPAFASCQGSWRPDFLFNTPEAISQSTTNSTLLENPQICEINARFMFNAFFGVAFTHEAYQKMGFESFGLKSPVEPSKIYAAFKETFDINNPIHLVKSSEPGLDIHLFEYYFRERCGLKVKFIKPEQLRLVPNTNWGFGPTLCCVVSATEVASDDGEDINEWRLVSPKGEVLEKVHQVALELHQSELESLGIDMLKSLAPLCRNDLRTIYLVHDKRMLGIVLQELDSLVEKNILSKQEAETLRKGIAQTILAGSPELQNLIRCTQNGVGVKDNFVLKLTGSGKGVGIIFGTDISTEAWMEYLAQLSGPDISGAKYVIQRVARQPKFNVIVPSKSGKPIIEHNYVVGTFMMVDGKQLGNGCWRTGPGRICAISHGGSWTCSLVRHSNSTAPVLATESEIPRIAAHSLEDAKDIPHVSAIDTALQKYGIMAITLEFSDPDSSYLLNLVRSLQRNHGHGEPLSHSSTRGWFWDVKPTPKSISAQHHARSETMDDFPWHTDCSYALEPPRFFGLHVLQADRCGGGTLSVVQLDKVLQFLSKESVETLSQEKFRLEVPPEFEFKNGVKSVIGQVLKPVGAGTGLTKEMKCRYRADIIHPLTEKATSALEDLNKALAQARSNNSDICLNLSPEMIPNGTVLLMDNGRWLHARNSVKDPERHLRRIRWDAREF